MTDPMPITPAQSARLLEAALVTLRAELTGLPDSVRAWHPAPGEWCAKEVLGHLIEAERRGFAGRIRTILAANEPALEVWDQDAVAQARGDCARDVDEILANVQEFVWPAMGNAQRFSADRMRAAGP